MLVACGGADPVPVTPPSPAAAAARPCERLHDGLPASIDGRDRRDTTPDSALTAAWRDGDDPAVVLRCGVPAPPGLTPTSEVVEVDGVGWYLDPATPYVFTSVGRVANVEVRVPRETPRDAATAPLTDLAEPVADAVPERSRG